MALRFYNTLTRQKEEFKPLTNKQVGMYTCGPTVYNYPHIGNYRAYVFADLLKRHLKQKGYKVKHVMNITDVDDKTIKHSKEQGKTLKEFTSYYTQAFKEDLEKLNIQPANEYPLATEHINEMIEIIKKLVEKGLAYKADDGCVYYSVSKFEEYGKLAHIQPEELKEGASGRMLQDEYEKQNAQDFALWKAWTEEDGDVWWESPWGKGRPGWHIECTAMSMKYLGEEFDIHTGGVDLIFPHHENEIAQSEGATGKDFVKCWMHNEWLLVEGKKMSKSTGNFYTLRDLLKQGHSPNAIRYLLLATHYRQQLNFTFDGLEAAKGALDRLKDFKTMLQDRQEGEKHEEVEARITLTQKRFEEALDNDLEISTALGEVFSFIKEMNKMELTKQDADRILEFLQEIDKVLGIVPSTEVQIPKKVKELVQEREQARKEKNWEKSDQIRDKLKELGYTVEDTTHGARIKLA